MFVGTPHSLKSYNGFAMENLQFHITKMDLFLGQYCLCFKVVKLNKLASIKCYMCSM